ncbi:unnamed protein product, partial [marine sediment metagenome]
PLTSEGLEITTGLGSIEILFPDDALSVSGNLDLTILDFVDLNGNFAFEKNSEPVTATLADSSTVNVEVLTIGASGVTGFAGVNGPASNSNAMGISLSDINFALVLMSVSSPAPGDNRSWTALRAEVGSISLKGISGFGLTVESFILELNTAGGEINGAANSAVVNFAVSDFDGNTVADGGYTVDLGGGNTVLIDFETELLRVGGTLEVLDGFIYIRGEFGFEKSSIPVTATLANSTSAPVDILAISAKDVTAFVGVNG